MTAPMFVSTKEDLVAVANNVLFEIDPAITYCNMNEGMENEYLTEAELIAEYFITDNMMLKRAVTKVFDKQFVVYNEEKLLEAYRKINEYLV